MTRPLLSSNAGKNSRNSDSFALLAGNARDRKVSPGLLDLVFGELFGRELALVPSSRA